MLIWILGLGCFPHAACFSFTHCKTSSFFGFIGSDFWSICDIDSWISLWVGLKNAPFCSYFGIHVHWIVLFVRCTLLRSPITLFPTHWILVMSLNLSLQQTVVLLNWRTWQVKADHLHQALQNQLLPPDGYNQRGFSVSSFSCMSQWIRSVHK